MKCTVSATYPVVEPQIFTLEQVKQRTGIYKKNNKHDDDRRLVTWAGNVIVVSTALSLPIVFQDLSTLEGWDKFTYIESKEKIVLTIDNTGS